MHFYTYENILFFDIYNYTSKAVMNIATSHKVFCTSKSIQLGFKKYNHPYRFTIMDLCLQYVAIEMMLTKNWILTQNYSKLPHTSFLTRYSIYLIVNAE